MNDYIKKPITWTLVGGIAIGSVLPTFDDGFFYRDLQQDMFAVVGSTGPTATNAGGDGGIEIQNNITGDIFPGPGEEKQRYGESDVTKRWSVVSFELERPSTGNTPST